MPEPRRASVHGPQIESIRHDQLTAGTADLLTARADLEGLSFREIDSPAFTISAGTVHSCQFVGISAREADWKSTRIVESTFERLDVPVMRAARGVWRDLRFDGARLGSVESYETSWRSVHFVGCKLSFINLRGAELVDVLFTDCVIEELDLVQATARRVAFRDCRVASLNVQHAELENVDLRGAELEEISALDGLRGATISPVQLSLLGPLLAAERGIRVG